MKILKLQTLKGPNYWSIRRPNLIVMHLDLEDLDEVFSDQISGFYDGLVAALPSLEEHFCSEGHRGGFLERVKDGTLMGHIIEHVAIELQQQAGMAVDFGRARAAATPGVYRVVFEYQVPEAGRYAARAAVRLVESIVDCGYYPQAELVQDLADLRQIWAEASLGPTTEAIVQEAIARNIPWRELPARRVIQFGYGVNQRHIQASQTDGTSILGVEMAGDKASTITLLQEAAIPVPKGRVIAYLDELEDAIEAVGKFPIVIKPLDGNHGRGITLNIQSYREAEVAYDRAKAESRSRSVMVERFYQGKDHRALVVNGKVVAVAERVPAHVIGDGYSTIRELVEIANRDPNRGYGHENVLTQIIIDGQSELVLRQQELSLDSIPELGKICYLKATANLSTGGIAIDRTDEIHPETVWFCERAARIVGLDIAGIDITTPDISKSLRDVDGVIVEVNAAPGLRMHLQPSQGMSRNVAAPILDLLYPKGTSARIPVIAVTGTNGKTTTTRLIAHLFRQTKKTVGYTTTDGTYIGDFLAELGDNTGPQSAGLILNDPTTEVAVLETARGGILRSGLAFNQCDVSVILNVSADHLGLQDIHTVEDLAHVKSVVAEVANPDGYVILNADDPLVVKMAERVKAKIAYFSMDRWNPIVCNHVQNGGIAAIYEEGYISIVKRHEILRVEQAVNIPLTLRGLAPFMIANALAATLAAYVQNICIEDISTALRTFRASIEQTPGRMNLIDLGQFHALIDYAHNPASYQALGEFVQNWSTGERVGVIGGPGDRRDEDFRELGRLAAQIFDRVFIKEDDDTRGRPRGEAAALIREGICLADPDFTYVTILDETTAIEAAFATATEGSLVVILPESVDRTLSLLQQPLVLNQ
ncbi:MAG: cyanophycin synthetase [Elainellaceae cyanobacterium]